jgi:hypothetical protein
VLTNLDCAPAAVSQTASVDAITCEQPATQHGNSTTNGRGSAARRRRDSSSAQPRNSKRDACIVHNSALLIDDADGNIDALDAHMQSKGAFNGNSKPAATAVSKGGYAAQAQARLALQQKAVPSTSSSRTQQQQPSVAARTNDDSDEEATKCYSRAQQQQQQQLQQQQQQHTQQYDCYADDDSLQQQDDTEPYYEQQQWERIPYQSHASTPRAVSPPPVRSHKLAQQAAVQLSPDVSVAPAAAAAHKAHAQQQAAQQQQQEQQQQYAVAQGYAQYVEPQQQHAALPPPQSSSDDCELQQQQPVQQQQQQQRKRRPRPRDSDSAWSADSTANKGLTVKPTREEINAKHVHTSSDLLLFSRKARHVEYEPFTVAEWRKSKPRYAASDYTASDYNMCYSKLALNCCVTVQ